MRTDRSVLMSTAPRHWQDPRLRLVPASSLSHAWLALLSFVVPVALALGLPPLMHRFDSTAHWVSRSLQVQAWIDDWIAPGIVVLLMAGLWIALECLLRRHRLLVDEAGITVATTLYTRRLPWRDLDLVAAKVIDIEEHTGSRPLLKSNGVAVPGFRSGWFRGRDFSRLFVATAGGTRLLRIPTRLGYTLLLQVVDPGLLLDRMRTLSPVDRTGKTPGARGR
jgi:hypothetical protein